MEKLKQILTSKKTKSFLWQTANGAIAIIITGFTDVDYIYAPIIIAMLNGITKHINKTYLMK